MNSKLQWAVDGATAYDQDILPTDVTTWWLPQEGDGFLVIEEHTADNRDRSSRLDWHSDTIDQQPPRSELGFVVFWEMTPLATLPTLEAAQAWAESYAERDLPEYFAHITNQ